jgi:hydrophobe/amphiphile efflux-1 (HAE1) family protein
MSDSPTTATKENFFVRRPIFAIVISIVLVAFGAVSLSKLPIAMYPEVVPPEIQVSSIYSGADSTAVESSVSTPLEQKINGVENSIYIRSINANDGTSSIRVSFEVGSDLDMSNVLVQNRVSEGQASLPEDVKRFGVTVKKSLSFPLMLLALNSPKGSFDANFLSNYALINVNDEISRIKGVGQVTLFGGSDYAMRIWINPSKIASLGMTVTDIVKAIQSQNVIAPGGKIGGEPAPPGTTNTYPIRLQGRLESPEEFAEIIVKANEDGSLVKVKDIGRVELGAQNYNAIGRLNGSPSAVLAIYQTPGTNALEISATVRKTIAKLKESFPEDLDYTISLDTTKAVTAGMEEIVHTLLEAIVLVVLVVFIFLQSWRATIIPILTVPVALVATFAIFPLLGFGVNTLSLLGLILAIGIVVDDAIVVVEAVMHHIEHGLSPRDATNKAMEEVSGPVIAIALILAAVFVPVVFMGGISGRFYEQFAVTIAVSVLFSAISALTLSPALCSLLLKPHAAPSTGLLSKFFGGFNSIFDKITMRYVDIAGFFSRKLIRAFIFFAIVLVGVAFFGKSLPNGFVPEEDQGYLLAGVQLRPASSLQETDKATKQVEQIIMDTPGVELVTTVTGFSLVSSAYGTNTGFFFISLRPWKERTSKEEHAFNITSSLNKRLAAALPGFQSSVFGPPAIAGLGTGAGFSLMLQDRQGRSPQFLAEESQKFMEAVRRRPEIGQIMTMYSANTPQFYSTIDRAKALKQGVALSDFNQTMGSFLGGTYVNDFNSFGRLYKVYVQAEPEFRDSLNDLMLYHLRNDEGGMVPISTLITNSETAGPDYTNRFNLFRAAELTGVPAKGYSSNDAMLALEEVAKSSLSSGVSYAWNAMSYQERNAPASSMVFLFGIFFVFLILAAQYESWSLPFSVLLGTPFAVLGALGGLWIGRQIIGDAYLNNIFAQIGILTLIGLAAKNAILIVEFARMKTSEGMPILDAALESAKLRFRPILMTAFAFILGVVPLTLASGSGAEGRKVMGLAVFSGMLVATIIGVMLIPALYVFIESLSKKRRIKRENH